MSGGLTVEGSDLRSKHVALHCWSSALNDASCDGIRWLLATHLTVQYSAMLSLNIEDK